MTALGLGALTVMPQDYESRVELPSSPPAQSGVLTPSLTVYLAADDEIFLQGEAVSEAEMLARLAQVDAVDRKQTRIMVKAGRKVEYAVVMGLMDRINKTGFDKISLVSAE